MAEPGAQGASRRIQPNPDDARRASGRLPTYRAERGCLPANEPRSGYVAFSQSMIKLREVAPKNVPLVAMLPDTSSTRKPA